MKERENSARRKREEIERKREDQERRRVENEGDRTKGGSRERAGRQGKACTAERVDLQFPDHRIEHSEKGGAVVEEKSRGRRGGAAEGRCCGHLEEDHTERGLLSGGQLLMVLVLVLMVLVLIA